MKKVGGFFELEIPRGESLYHDNAIMLSTGRACLNYVLQIIKPIKVFVPYYCCDALYEPMIINNVEYSFYSINEQLEIVDIPKIKKNELIIYCDFFGIKSKYVSDLIKIFNDQLVIDNSHSFFRNLFGLKNISFTTARKYFGVPDGAFLYLPNKTKNKFNLERNQTISINHNLHSLLNMQDVAYKEFVDYEKTLNSDIKKISIISEKLLKTINYKLVREKRNLNFRYLKKEFDKLNMLLIDEEVIDCFCYPLLLKKTINKEKLFKENIFIPNYWIDTTKRKEKNKYIFECDLSKNLLPLPIDHRLTINDLKRVVQSIKKQISYLE